MALVVVNIDMGDGSRGDGKVVERLVGSEILEGDHIDRTDEIPLAVIRQKRTHGKRARINVEGPEAGEKIWQLHQRAHFLEGAAGRGLHERPCFSSATSLRDLTRWFSGASP